MRSAESIAKEFIEKISFAAPEIRDEKVLEFVRYIQRDASTSVSSSVIADIAAGQHRLGALERAAIDAVFGLDQLAREEAARKGTTFEMCDYTFTKRLRDAIDDVARQRAGAGRSPTIPDRIEIHKWGGKTYSFGDVRVVVDHRHEPHTWDVHLGHSCDNWEVGNTIEAVEAFKQDIEAAYEFVLTFGADGRSKWE